MLLIIATKNEVDVAVRCHMSAMLATNNYGGKRVTFLQNWAWRILAIKYLESHAISELLLLVSQRLCIISICTYPFYAHISMATSSHHSTEIQVSN